MINSDEVQKKLNALLEGKDDDLDEDVFLREDNQVIEPAKQEIVKEERVELPAASKVEEQVRVKEELPAEVPVIAQEKEEPVPEKKKSWSLPPKETLPKPENNFFSKQGELNDKIKAMESGREEDEIKLKAMGLGFGYINLKGLPIMPDFLKLIDEEDAKEAMVVCFLYKKGEEIRLAAAEVNTRTQELIEKIKSNYPSERISIFLTSPESIEAALRLYASLPRRVARVDDIKVLEGEIEQSRQEIGDIKEIQDKVNSASTTEIIGVLIMAATRIEASDIHIEAEEQSVKVRFRIDGVLHDVAVLAKEAWGHLVSRIKLNAGLKINIQDRPQDGNFTLTIEGKPMDFRVSTLPTNYGESVAIRILYHDKIRKMSLDNLGIDEYNRAILEREITKPNGLLVVTGPTGSGKTTTLYSILNKLNSSDNKIITVEDPVEYKLEGINQSEVRDEKGYTFAKALRSLVRQDPDIILVGEIRDEETVEIVLNAALTGHLVLSTIHTNSAAGTIPRFMALGAKPYLLSPAINVAISQRLVRRVCETCKEPEVLSEIIKERLREEVTNMPDKYKNIISQDNFEKIIFYKGKGCKECSGLGYKGQIAIFEILQINDQIKTMILSGDVSEQQVKQAGMKEGMVTLAQDGILKAVKGITSLEEVFRVA